MVGGLRFYVGGIWGHISLHPLSGAGTPKHADNLLNFGLESLFFTTRIALITNSVVHQWAIVYLVSNCGSVSDQTYSVDTRKRLCCQVYKNYFKAIFHWFSYAFCSLPTSQTRPPSRSSSLPFVKVRLQSEVDLWPQLAKLTRNRLGFRQTNTQTPTVA